MIHRILDEISKAIPLPLIKPVETLSQFVLVLQFHFWVKPSISNGNWVVRAIDTDKMVGSVIRKYNGIVNRPKSIPVHRAHKGMYFCNV
ncbi:hypothetical protein bcgnr5390_12530 [Bacillus luti]|nr:hypothetical protein BC2903_51210 [Bacillus cereus]